LHVIKLIDVAVVLYDFINSVVKGGVVLHEFYILRHERGTCEVS
jgi:hypothetical protein